MLPKSSRIPRSGFSPLLTSRHFTHSPHFTLRVSLGSNKTPRIAVSVGKKVSKSAVVRNTVRRRVYSSLRTLLPTLSPGLYLFVAKLGAEKVRGQVLLEEVKSLLNRL